MAATVGGKRTKVVEEIRITPLPTCLAKVIRQSWRPNHGPSPGHAGRRTNGSFAY
jgi:hypothetical protein